METRYLVVLGLSLFAMGVLGGFYLYAILQNQIEVLIPATVVLVFLTWLGSGADFLGLLRDWYKERKHEEARIASLPKLNVIYDPDANTDIYGPAKPFAGYANLSGNVVRKHIRIYVENTGGGVAERCEAKLSLITNNHDGTNPSMEEKILQWTSTNITQQDIGVHNRQLLNVVFSVDRDIYEKKFAFICTSVSLNGPNIPRIEDAFNVGSYDFELVIRAFDGTSIRTVFRVNVTSNWSELSMRRIE